VNFSKTIETPKKEETSKAIELKMPMRVFRISFLSSVILNIALVFYLLFFNPDIKCC
jgi:hypothetical protein